MTSPQDGSPSLREALLRLERGRAREAGLRRDSEAMLGAIQIVARGGNPGLLFRNLIDHFQPIVGFDWVGLLRKSSEGAWKVCRDIQPEHPEIALQHSSTFERAIQGETIVAFDARSIEGLSDCETQLRSPIGSALIYALEFEGHPILCVCFHADRGRFSREHTKLVDKFRPLLNQALSVASAELARGQVLKLQSQSREYSKQIQLLETGTNAIGVGLLTWDGESAPRNPSETLLKMVSPWPSLDAWWSDLSTRLGRETMSHNLSAGETLEIEVESPTGVQRTYTVACALPGPFMRGTETPLLVTDRTERVREEEERNRAEARFRNLFHSSADGVVVLNADGQVIESNEKANQLLQLDNAEQIQSWVDLHTEEFVQKAAQAISTASLQQEDRYQADLRGRHGPLFTAEILLKKIQVGGESLIQVIFRDVTQQQEAQLQLKQSEAHKSAVLKAALDCIISIDRNGRIIEFNPAAEATLGWTRDEVIGHRMSEFFIPEEHRADHDAGLLRFLETGKANVLGKRLELPAITKSGETILTEAAITQTIGLDGRPMFTGFLRDITEQKAAQNALRVAKEEAEAASSAKSDFLASMSHELRTPLHVIAGISELARERKANAEFTELLSVIDSSTRSLLRLIDDLLDISRIEAGQLPIQSENVDLSALLEDLHSMFSYRAGEKNLELEWRVSEAVPKLVRTDPARLRQILVNLLSNAIKFTETGRVTLRVEVHGEDRAPTLRLIVRDTGQGFDITQRDKLFERFEQLGREDQGLREAGGVGLGLAISHGLAELMGGTLSADSEIGRGSEFALDLPIEVVHADSLSQSPSQSSQAGQATEPLQILVVDDHADNRLLAERMLTGAGHTVVLAESGQEALALAKSQKPDLVLMDVEMPEWNGFETTRRFHEHPELAHLPILALTAHAVRGFRERCLEAGMDGYLSKPFSRQELLQVIGAYSFHGGDASQDRAIEGEIVSVDDDIIDLIPDYLEGSIALAEDALRAAQQRNLDEVRAIAHKIKGSGSSYGFPRISELGSDLHAAAVGEEAELAAEAGEELIQYLANVRYQARSASSK